MWGHILKKRKKEGVKRGRRTWEIRGGERRSDGIGLTIKGFTLGKQEFLLASMYMNALHPNPTP